MKPIDGDALIAWIKESQHMTSKMKNVICKIETMPSADRPQGDSVSRQYLLAEIDDLADEFSEVDENGLHSERWCGIIDAKCVIANAPLVADRPQGEWIYGEHNVAMCDGYRCNRCDFFVPWDYEHKFIDFINDYHFCPNCGYQMKGADDETD